MESAAYGRGTARSTPRTRAHPIADEIEEESMEADELAALLQRDTAGVNQRISDLGAHLGERIDDTNARLDRFEKQVDKRFDELVSHLRVFEQRMFDQFTSVQAEIGRRIDAVQQLRLQGLALVVALTATSAIVGTFALQLFAMF